MSTSARQMLSPGEQIAGYLIDSYIARGGMAVVYRARDLQLGRWVAVKVMAPELAQNEKFRQRFVRESELAAAIDHPNILPIYQAGEADDLLYIAMRYVEGQDLGNLLATQGALEPYVALPIFTQIAAALDTAHAHGLVHRDVKPGNVLLSRAPSVDGAHVYLTDFGLTKRSTSLSGFTTAGHFLGTIQYVAPEQIAARTVDERADIYAMGCVLYEALTGQPPFQREDDAALLWAHINDDPPPVHSIRPALPATLDDVLRHAMAKEVTDRPESCRAVIAELRAAFRAARPVPGTRSPADFPQQPPAPPPSVPPAGMPGAAAASAARPETYPPQDGTSAGAQQERTGETPAPSSVAGAQQGAAGSLPPPAGSLAAGPGQAGPLPPGGGQAGPGQAGPEQAGPPSGNRRRRLVAVLVAVALVVLAVVGGWLLLNANSRFASFADADGTFTLERPADWSAHRGRGVHSVCFCRDGMEALFEGGAPSAWATISTAAAGDPSSVDGLYIQVAPGDPQFQVTSAAFARRRIDGINDSRLSFSGVQHVVINDATGFRVDGTMRPPGGGVGEVSLRFRYYLLDSPRGSAQVVFFALPDRFDDLSATFERVAGSIRLE